MWQTISLCHPLYLYEIFKLDSYYYDKIVAAFVLNICCKIGLTALQKTLWSNINAAMLYSVDVRSLILFFSDVAGFFG
jgi:hypothetical protein